jgi:hypothetical protein
MSADPRVLPVSSAPLDVTTAGHSAFRKAECTRTSSSICCTRISMARESMSGNARAASSPRALPHQRTRHLWPWPCMAPTGHGHARAQIKRACRARPCGSAATAAMRSMQRGLCKHLDLARCDGSLRHEHRLRTRAWAASWAADYQPHWRSAESGLMGKRRSLRRMNAICNRWQPPCGCGNASMYIFLIKV